MKIPLSQKQYGGVLVTTLVMCATMGIVIASFLALTSSRNVTTMRSQAWNSAIPVLEAGIEEALTHIHADKAPEDNGWVKAAINGQTVYQKRRDFAASVGYSLVTISNLTSDPVIYSRGFVPAPLGRGQISRLVRVTTKVEGPIPNGLLAQRRIVFNGGTYFVKSFNSEDPNYSTNGHFILSKSLDHARVLSVSGTVNAVDIGNSWVFGSVGTGGGGSVGVGPGGIVGDANWVTNGINAGTIQPDHLTDDVNVYIPDVTLPSGRRWFSPRVNVPVNGTNYAYLIESGDYMMDNITMSGKGVMYVTGECSLYVEKNFNVSGLASVYMAPGSSLKIYVGASCSIGGGGIVNNTGYAKNLSINGLPTCTSVTYSGGSDFIGVINAPQANVMFTGGSTIVGAVIGKNITLAGSGYFIYDEALRDGDSKFTITSYREL